jgi:hypothetical protein
MTGLNYGCCSLGLVHKFRFSTGRELTGRARAQLGTSFTRFGFRPAGRFRLSPDKAAVYRKQHAYSHNPVVWPAGKKPECVNLFISNTCTTADSATGRRLGIAMGSSGCYPAAGRPAGYTTGSCEYADAFLCSTIVRR